MNADDNLPARLQQWVEHNRGWVLQYLNEFEMDRNVIGIQACRAQLDLINRLERQLLLDQPPGARWRIP